MSSSIVHALAESERDDPGARHIERVRAVMRQDTRLHGIEPTAYDTAWIAALPSLNEPERPRFPAALDWLRERQHPDGSWGGSLCYEHDRILSTLAALPALAAFGTRPDDRSRVLAGTRYLWKHAHRLKTEPIELVGFELLLPTLIERAQEARVAVPPNLDIYGAEREAKLALLPPQALYSPRTTAVHSLEFLGRHADVARLRDAQSPNGSIGSSPAATAFFLSHIHDQGAVDYLNASMARAGGAAAPVVYPCETYEILWAAYHFFLIGIPAAHLLTTSEQALLKEALRSGGVSISPSTFPLPDADDTAVALLLLHDLGEPVDPKVLAAFASTSGHFASYPHERHASVGVNLHVLHALLRVPGYPDGSATAARLVDTICGAQIDGAYWFDKWHISPYYATAHTLCVFAELPESGARAAAAPVARAQEWLRETQNEDGSWGFYGVPTAEETAYGVLALIATGPRSSNPDCTRIAAALRWLRQARATMDAASLPPLWIEKCLYTPPRIVRAVIEAAEIGGEPFANAISDRVMSMHPSL